MLIQIPRPEDVVPGSEYKGFTLLPSSDPRADQIREVETSTLFLAYPSTLVYNDERRGLNSQGIIFGIGLGIALRDNPEHIPRFCKASMRDRPMKLMTSTMMLSEYDNRVYVAYYYIAPDGKLTLSFIGDDWASRFPSPAIHTLT